MPVSSASNVRGRRSKEEILDVAARIMGERGYSGTSMSMLMDESGLPKSAFYHHFRSKAGLLTAVMARGAYQFFEGMRVAHEGGPGPGTPRERLEWFLTRTGDVFLSQPQFLRLHFMLLVSADAEDAEVRELIDQVRRDGRAYMREMIATAFAGEGPEVAEKVAAELDYFGIAGFDGAFIALQADPARGLHDAMTLVAEAIAALGAARVAALRPGARKGRARP